MPISRCKQSPELVRSLLQWLIEPAPGDCSIVTDHIFNIVAGSNERKADCRLRYI